MSTKAEDRAAENEWADYKRALERAAVVDVLENAVEKQKRIARLEAPGNEEEWFKYYFPNYYKAEPAKFHTDSTKWLMANMEGYLVRAWSRETAKDVRTMMESIKLMLTKRKKFALLISSSLDKAIKLLKPYQINFESNPRIINDYGEQRTFGEWAENGFTIKAGATMIAIGKGQTPRGLRNEDVRPDLLIITDMDTDEGCRNPEMVKQDWDWFEKAAYPTRSVSEPFLVIWLGNIIADDSCIVRALEVKRARKEIVNIEDENGNSNWPQKNTNAMILLIKESISYAAFQGEYMNNPITEGLTFADIYLKPMMPLRAYGNFLVSYCDPSYKSGRKNDYKAVALVGKYRDEYHVIKIYCAQTTTAIMLGWHYLLLRLVSAVMNIFFLIEWPWIDESLKLEIAAADKREDITLPLMPDERDKPDKYFRIESLLEPLNRNGKLWFNVADKDTEHMKIVRAQFKAFGPKSKAHDDAPDAVEGAIWTINNKTINNSDNVVVQKAQIRNNRR